MRIKYFLGNLQNVTMWHGFRGRIGTVRNLRERPAGYPARAFGFCGRKRRGAMQKKFKPLTRKRAIQIVMSVTGCGNKRWVNDAFDTVKKHIAGNPSNADVSFACCVRSAIVARRLVSAGRPSWLIGGRVCCFAFTAQMLEEHCLTMRKNATLEVI